MIAEERASAESVRNAASSSSGISRSGMIKMTVCPVGGMARDVMSRGVSRQAITQGARSAVCTAQRYSGWQTTKQQARFSG